MNVIVARRVMLGPDVVMLDLHPVSGTLPVFTAGGHIDVHVGEFIRQYSLCNDPADNSFYRIAVLKETNSRGGSKAMHDLREGDALHVDPPRNLFALEPGRGAILIGGGIGITPLLAMAYELSRQEQPFRLHYAMEEARYAAFEAALHEVPFAGRSQLHRTNFAEGRLFDTASVLSASTSDEHLYVCGPEGFMTAVIASAQTAGWSASRIHQEHFHPAPVLQGEPFTVVARKSGVIVEVGEEQTIAAALMEAGVEVPLSCEQGVCGTCLTAIIEGVADHRDLVLTPQEQAENRVLAVCCSRAKTSRLVLDI